jgi:hypothetical protein
MSLGAEELNCLRNWQLQNKGKKGIRLCQEDFMCDLKWQWDCAEIRYQDTTSENKIIVHV